MTTADLAGFESGRSRSAAATDRTGVATSAPPGSPAPQARAPSEAHDGVRLLDHFREAVLVLDTTGVVRDFNAVAARLLPGLTLGRTLAGSDVPDLAPGEFTHKGRRLRGRWVGLAAGGSAWYLDDVTDTVARADALLAERGRARFLASASQRLGNPLHEDRAARAAVRLAVPTLGDVAVVVRAPRSGRAAWWRAVAGDPPPVDRGLLGGDDLPPAVAEALDGGEPSEVDWLAQQFADAGWLEGHEVADVAARVVSLPGSAAATGALLVARTGGRQFDEHDVQMLREFAARAGAALDAAVLYRDQAEVAETLQASLAPIEPPEVAGIEWGTAYRPAQASLRIGGDFYGVHPLADGSTLFYLGDVSGKGVDAAIFTGQIRQGLQALRGVETDPARLMRLLNDSVLETTRSSGTGRFATMVLGRARPAAGGGLTLTLASGGHLPPLVLRADGRVEVVELRGMLVGVVPDPRVSHVTVHLGAGETCLLYSDGVTEARGGARGEQYGGTRLTDSLADCHRMPAPALAERVEQLTCDWLAGREHDDIAALAIRAVPFFSTKRHLHAVPRRNEPR